MNSSSSSPSPHKCTSSISSHTKTNITRRPLHYGYGFHNHTNTSTLCGTNNYNTSIGSRNQQQCQITRAIQTFAHTQTAFQRYFYSRKHFPKILTAFMTFGGFVGFTVMEYLANVQLEEKRKVYVDAYHHHGRNDTQIVRDIGRMAEDSIRSTTTTSSASSLARKMTHKTVDVVNSVVREGSSGILNRQITKFW
mmetsp:Transcript_5218/g.10679  ORF Transcript_5218/g.10679 Transcript_5218/m.10679 type:complete len:194 (+) Transcript_5218:129-710(+)